MPVMQVNTIHTGQAKPAATITDASSTLWWVLLIINVTTKIDAPIHTRYVQTYICTYVHTYIHTHIHTYVHTYSALHKTCRHKHFTWNWLLTGGAFLVLIFRSISSGMQRYTHLYSDPIPKLKN